MNPIVMMLDGWCDDCDQDPAECFNRGECLGDIKNKEDTDEQQSEDGTI